MIYTVVSVYVSEEEDTMLEESHELTATVKLPDFIVLASGYCKYICGVFFFHLCQLAKPIKPIDCIVVTQRMAVILIALTFFILSPTSLAVSGSANPRHLPFFTFLIFSYLFHTK